VSEKLADHDQVAWYAAYLELNPDATHEEFEAYRELLLANVVAVQ